MSRIPEIMSLKSVLSGDLVQFIEGIIQAFSCLVAAEIIQKDLGKFLVIPIGFHVLSCAIFGFYGKKLKIEHGVRSKGI